MPMLFADSAARPPRSLTDVRSSAELKFGRPGIQRAFDLALSNSTGVTHGPQVNDNLNCPCDGTGRFRDWHRRSEFPGATDCAADNCSADHSAANNGPAHDRATNNSAADDGAPDHGCAENCAAGDNPAAWHIERAAVCSGRHRNWNSRGSSGDARDNAGRTVVSEHAEPAVVHDARPDDVELDRDSGFVDDARGGCGSEADATDYAECRVAAVSARIDKRAGHDVSGHDVANRNRDAESISG